MCYSCGRPQLRESRVKVMFCMQEYLTFVLPGAQRFTFWLHNLSLPGFHVFWSSYFLHCGEQEASSCCNVDITFSLVFQK